MNEYVKMANDFCAKYGIEIDMFFVGKRRKWGDIRNTWKFTITKDDKKYSSYFYDSIANTKKGCKRPSNYDLLACLTKYDPEDFETFCLNFGYDEYKQSSKDIYNAVVAEYDGLCEVFGTDAENEQLWEDFREIY